MQIKKPQKVGRFILDIQVDFMTFLFCNLSSNCPWKDCSICYFLVCVTFEKEGWGLRLTNMCGYLMNWASNCYLRFEICLKQEVVGLMKVVILTAPKSTLNIIFNFIYPFSKLAWSLLRSQGCWSLFQPLWGRGTLWMVGSSVHHRTKSTDTHIITQT